MNARAYPIPHPESGSDPRFSHGLTHDIGKVLESHGFPPVKNGTDIVDLMLALFRFVYPSEDRPVPIDEAPGTAALADVDPTPPLAAPRTESQGWYSPSREYFPDAGSEPTAEELAEDDRALMGDGGMVL